jgi:hypothetical protein
MVAKKLGQAEDVRIAAKLRIVVLNLINFYDDNNLLSLSMEYE